MCSIYVKVVAFFLLSLLENEHPMHDETESQSGYMPIRHRGIDFGPLLLIYPLPHP